MRLIFMLGVIAITACSPPNTDDFTNGASPTPAAATAEAPPVGIEFEAPDSIQPNPVRVVGSYLVDMNCPIVDHKEDQITSFNCVFSKTSSKTPYYKVPVTAFEASKKSGDTETLAATPPILVNGVETHVLSVSVAKLAEYTNIRAVIKDLEDPVQAEKVQPLTVDDTLVLKAIRLDKKYLLVQAGARLNDSCSGTELLMRKSDGVLKCITPYNDDETLFSGITDCAAKLAVFQEKTDITSKCQKINGALFGFEEVPCPTSPPNPDEPIVVLAGDDKCKKITRQNHQ